MKMFHGSDELLRRAGSIRLGVVKSLSLEVSD